MFVEIDCCAAISVFILWIDRFGSAITLYIRVLSEVVANVRPVTADQREGMVAEWSPCPEMFTNCQYIYKKQKTAGQYLDRFISLELGNSDDWIWMERTITKPRESI